MATPSGSNSSTPRPGLRASGLRGTKIQDIVRSPPVDGRRLRPLQVEADHFLISCCAKPSYRRHRQRGRFGARGSNRVRRPDHPPRLADPQRTPVGRRGRCARMAFCHARREPGRWPPPSPKPRAQWRTRRAAPCDAAVGRCHRSPPTSTPRPSLLFVRALPPRSACCSGGAAYQPS